MHVLIFLQLGLFPRDRTVRYRLPGGKENEDAVTVANFVANELRMDSNR